MAEEDERVLGIASFEHMEVQAAGRCTVDIVFSDICWKG
jgi:hypothetical protein